MKNKIKEIRFIFERFSILINHLLLFDYNLRSCELQLKIRKKYIINNNNWDREKKKIHIHMFDI